MKQYNWKTNLGILECKDSRIIEESPYIARVLQLFDTDVYEYRIQVEELKKEMQQLKNNHLAEIIALKEDSLNAKIKYNELLNTVKEL